MAPSAAGRATDSTGSRGARPWHPRRVRIALLSWLLVACGAGAPEAAPAPDPLAGLSRGSDAWILAHAPLYVEGDRASRHAVLEASLTSHDNAYARVRLASYAIPTGGWDGLPEWRPRTRPLEERDLAALAAGVPELGDAQPLPAAPEGRDWEAWRALGERVFFELPLRAEPSLRVPLASPSARDALGLEVILGRVPGVVVFAGIDGRTELGMTCALCHAAREGERLVPGRARRALDFGRLRLAAAEARGPAEERLRERYLSWGPGRADVLEQLSEVPIAIPDLWALRDVRHFTQAGTITHVSPIALAIRQETQFIQAGHLATRPPRTLMFALVVYLYSLAPPARAATPPRADAERGAMVFARECGRCHGARGYTGDLVPLAEIGTHPELGGTEARGTGHYRPQPLIDVRDAAPYLHHGVVPTLNDLLWPERLAETYERGRGGPGPIPGHAYGLALPEADRTALLGHLDTL